MAVGDKNPILSFDSVAARRAAYLDIMRRRIRPGRGSSLSLLRSRESYPMPDLNALLPGTRFVVVGGTATSLYMSFRTTKDVDILLTAADAPAAEEALRRKGATLIGPLDIHNQLHISGNSWRLPDGSELDVLRSAQPWVAEAIVHPNRDSANLPIAPLPYLVLMKLASGRGIDIGDLSRMLGAADDAILEETREVVRKYLPDAVDDLNSLAALGRLELQEETPPQSPSKAEEVSVRDHQRHGRQVRAHTRRRPRQ